MTRARREYGVMARMLVDAGARDGDAEWDGSDEFVAVTTSCAQADGSVVARRWPIEESPGTFAP